MHDDVHNNQDRGRSWWSVTDEPNEANRALLGMTLGLLFGGAIGLIVGGYTMTALGISMGSGVGWGLSRQYWAARSRQGNAVSGMIAGGASGGVLGGIAGVLTGWDALVVIGIAVGIALGANLGQRLGES